LGNLITKEKSVVNKRNLIIAAVILVIIIAWIIIPQGESIEVPVEIPGDTTAEELYEQAQGFVENRKLVEAKQAYADVLTNHPDYELVEDIQEQLEDVNMEIILSNAIAPEVVVH